MRDGGRLRRAGLAVLPPAALAAFALPPAARAQDPVPDPVSELVYAVEYAGDPRISPDGEWIVYVHRFADRAEDRWHAEIVRARANGSGRETLTSGPDDRAPRFSPEGNRLAYVSVADGFSEIRVLSLATRRRTDLAWGSSRIGTIAWDPAGRRIAFLRHGSDPDTRVHLFVADVSGGRERRLTSTGFPVEALPLDTPIVWTPDGSALLFSADPDPPDAEGDAAREGVSGDGVPARLDTEVLEIPSSGGGVRRVTTSRGPDDDPAVSPDGRHVAFVSAGPAGEGATPPGRALLVLERPGGALPRSVLGRAGLDVRRPAWSADGRQLFALLEGGGRARLVLVALDGSVRTLADGLGGGPAATAGRASFSVSADSANPRFAATAALDGSPEIVVGSRRPGDLARRATWINDDLELDARIEIDEITVAPDLPARVLAPAEPAPDGMPAIVVIHGGCGAAYTAGFDLELNALAAAGHTVLVLDPGRNADAVLAAADTLARRPGAARDRPSLLERSGDGTLAREALERSDAFRSAVVHRPPGCAGRAAWPNGDAERPAPEPAGAEPVEAADSVDAAEPAGAAPLLILDAPAHPFDEPPGALVARLRRTLDGLRAGEPD